MTSNQPLVLLTGATGYVGGRLLPLLKERPIRLICMARRPDELKKQRGQAPRTAAGSSEHQSSIAIGTAKQCHLPCGQAPRLHSTR